MSVISLACFKFKSEKKLFVFVEKFLQTEILLKEHFIFLKNSLLPYITIPLSTPWWMFSFFSAKKCGLHVSFGKHKKFGAIWLYFRDVKPLITLTSIH